MTLEEILKAIKEDEAIRKGIMSVIPELAEGKELLTNHAKAHFDQNIGPKIAEIYTNIDNDIFDVLGIKKKSDQKTYEFLKTDVLSELKKLKETDPGNDDLKSKKIKDLETQIETLTKDTTNSKFWHETHEKALKSWDKERETLNDKITNIEKENIGNLANTDLSMGLANLEFNPNIPKSAIDALTSNIKSEVLKSAKVVDGKVSYFKQDGTPWLDNQFKPIDAKGIFAEKLGDVLKTTPGGGGGAPTGKKGGIQTVDLGGKATKKLVLDKEKFSTRLGFMDEAEKTLIENGVEKNSSEWNSLQTEAYKEYEVEKLERS